MMKLLAVLLVVASVRAPVALAQSATDPTPPEATPAETGPPETEPSQTGPSRPTGVGSGVSSESGSPPAALPLGQDTRIEFVHAAGDLLLGPVPLTRIQLQNAGERTLISFGERPFPVSETLFLRFPQRAPQRLKNAWIVLLRSGDSIRARITRGPGASSGEGADAVQNEDSLHLLAAGLGDGPVEVPLSAITALIAETALEGRPGRLRDSLQARAQLIRQLRQMKVEEDVVLLRASDGAGGPQAASIEGIVEKLSEDGLTISSDRLGSVDVSYARLKALILAQLEDPAGDKADDADRERARDLRVQVRFHDGGSLVGRLDALGDGAAHVRHELIGDVVIGLEHVAEIAFLGGRVSYLSDRDPIHVHESPGPLFNASDRYAHKRDTNVLYGPLRMGGRIYRKGLGVHSYSLLEYALTEKDERFQATIGLDQSAHPFSNEVAAADVASVVFRVKVDGKLLFQKAMSWKDAPVPIEVPIKGEVLSLEVDFGGVPGSMNSTLDRADWADARLVRSSD